MIWLLACFQKTPPAPAVEEVEQAVRYNHVARAHYIRANMHRERGELSLAAAEYKRAILFDPKAAVLYLELAEVRAALGEDELALEYLREAALLGSEEARALLVEGD